MKKIQNASLPFPFLSVFVCLSARRHFGLVAEPLLMARLRSRVSFSAGTKQRLADARKATLECYLRDWLSRFDFYTVEILIRIYQVFVQTVQKLGK